MTDLVVIGSQGAQDGYVKEHGCFHNFEGYFFGFV